MRGRADITKAWTAALGRRLGAVVVCVCIVAALALTGCNARKKNTATARQYTAFITRYNIHYNGDKHYKETLEDMERDYEDDYSQLLYMHPAEARQNTKAPQPSGDFTRSIEKAQKAIQLRSITKKPPKKAGKRNDPEYKAWMKREEYNPFLHNDWLMMGRSQYMNGDFLGAASTFFYTSRHFFWLPRTITEARLWEARSYLAMDWLYEAENILTRVKPEEELVNNNLRNLYNLDWAALYIKRDSIAEAIPFVQQAVRYAKGNQKIRLQFLLGQLYERTGDKERAYQAFAGPAGSSSASYRTKFNARIKQSEVYTGANIEPEVRALRRMARYDRNKEYLDQVYYAIGNLYLSRRDTIKAIENYKEAVEKSTRSGIDKALAQITLGGLYYDRHEYELAQPCYSEAVPLLPDNYPELTTLKKRSDVLDELAVYSQNVNLQDSLLRLADMDSTKRMAVIDKIISDLKKKEKEEADAARREEFMANAAAQGDNLNQSNNSAPQQFNINTDDSWYFYNTAARNAGKTEFQRRWGSRKLEDNWRRRNKSAFSMGDFDSPGESEEAEETEGTEGTDESAAPGDSVAMAKADNPHFPEYYLKQIPFTPEQKATAHEVIQDGLYNMGVILKDKLEDFGAAETEFDRLLRDYPDNVYRLDVYYNLYLMYIRQGKDALAERYRQLILSDFADSKYGLALRNPDYIDNLRKMESEQQSLYEQAYEAYMSDDNKHVHEIYKDVSERYPLSKLMPKFMFLEALAYVTDRKPEEFNSTLRTLLERYPDTDLTPYASAWLKGMAQGRKLAEGTGNMRGGMLWSTSLGDSTSMATDSIPFTLDPQDRQLLVFVYPTDRVSTNQLLYEIARHNFNSFVVKDFDLEAMNFGRLGMIAIKDFENLDELNHYRRVMAQSSTFKLPAGVRPVVISVPNFDALLHSGGSLDDYFRFLEEQNYKDAQAGLLPYEEIEELPVESEERSVESGEEAAPEEAQPEEAAPQDQINPINQINPIDQPKPQPAAQPAPAPQPAQSKPAQPVKPKPAVIVPNEPETLEYDPGSEGDDPLFE